MNVKFTGKIIAAGQVQMGTSQNGTQWSSQEYVIEELNQQYPSRAVIQFTVQTRFSSSAFRLVKSSPPTSD